MASYGPINFPEIIFSETYSALLTNIGDPKANKFIL